MSITTCEGCRATAWTSSPLLRSAGPSSRVRATPSASRSTGAIGTPSAPPAATAPRSKATRPPCAARAARACSKSTGTRPNSRSYIAAPVPDESWAVDERSLKLFAEQLQGPPADRTWYDLRREAERIALVPGFDRLITLDANAIKELPHQIDVAQRVLRQMSGRASGAIGRAHA